MLRKTALGTLSHATKLDFSSSLIYSLMLITPFKASFCSLHKQCVSHSAWWWDCDYSFMLSLSSSSSNWLLCPLVSSGMPLPAGLLALMHFSCVLHRFVCCIFLSMCGKGQRMLISKPFCKLFGCCPVPECVPFHLTNICYIVLQYYRNKQCLTLSFTASVLSVAVNVIGDY